MSEPRDPASDGPADRPRLPADDRAAPQRTAAASPAWDDASTDPHPGTSVADARHVGSEEAGLLFPPADDPARAHRHDPAGEVGGPGPGATDEHLFGGFGGPPPSERSAGSAEDEDDPVAKGRGRGSTSFLRELPVLLVIAFVLAFLLRTFVVQVFYIPSSSMEPTLRIDDRMVVEKITYQFREPRRGEVVVFEGENFSTDTVQDPVPTRVIRGVGQFLGVVPASARDFVKRVIGLPGDEVLIEGGEVYVNGSLIDEPYVVYDDGADFGPVTVPPNALFFLGDNRPNSSDSRRSLGYVPMDQVVGRAAYIIWPFDHAGSLMEVEHDQVPDAPEVDDGTAEVLSNGATGDEGADGDVGDVPTRDDARPELDPVDDDASIQDHGEDDPELRNAA